MSTRRSASNVIWRTVVCAALAPACHHDQAKPAAPQQEEISQEAAPPDAALEDDEDLPLCSSLPEIEHPQHDVDVAPGDTTDGKIKVTVMSDPVGAEIWLDEGPAGNTPLILEREAGGYWLFVLKMPGYEDATMSIDTSDDADHAIMAKLIPEGSRPRCVDDEPHYDIGFVVS